MDKPITEMTPEEFDAWVDKYHERKRQKSDEPPPPLFYPTFKDHFWLEKVEETIELHGKIVDSQLQLHLPIPEAREDVQVHDNQIIIDNLRVVILLASSESTSNPPQWF
jgi:hypothetical protein